MSATLDVAPLSFAEAVAARVPEPDYVLGPLQPGDIGILSGADGAGKSLVALAMSASVAYGVSAAGVVDAPRHSGRVLYVAGEDRRDDHIRRLRRLAEHLRLEHGITAYDDQLTVWPLEVRRLPLVVPAGGGYSVTPLGRQLADALADYRLVVLDPLRMMHDCQESDGPGMDFHARWLVNVAMRHSHAILLVHHASQAAMLEGRTDHHAGRGATDLPAACRAAWTLRGMTQKEAESCGMSDDERRDWRVLVNSKASNAVEDGSRWLQRRGGLWVRSSYTPGEIADSRNGKRAGAARKGSVTKEVEYADF